MKINGLSKKNMYKHEITLDHGGITGILQHIQNCLPEALIIAGFAYVDVNCNGCIRTTPIDPPLAIHAHTTTPYQKCMHAPVITKFQSVQKIARSHVASEQSRLHCKNMHVYITRQLCEYYTSEVSHALGRIHAYHYCVVNTQTRVLDTRV